MAVTGGRFDGAIAGVGTERGVRVVVGAWQDSPFGPFTDLMVEQPDGRRVLVAPTAEVGRFVADTYGFDEVRVEDVATTRNADGLVVVAASVRVELTTGRRTLVGGLLHLVPRGLARQRWWCRLVDLPARLLRPGVRTIGTAGGGREERYCALDEHTVTWARVLWNGADQGALREVDPPVRFGFASAPRRPALVRVTTFVG